MKEADRLRLMFYGLGGSASMISSTPFTSLVRYYRWPFVVIAVLFTVAGYFFVRASILWRHMIADAETEDARAAAKVRLDELRKAAEERKQATPWARQDLPDA